MTDVPVPVQVVEAPAAAALRRLAASQDVPRELAWEVIAEAVYEVVDRLAAAKEHRLRFWPDRGPPDAR